jgi:hypothetical protein
MKMGKEEKGTICVPCPDCEQLIYLGLIPEEGQQVTCPSCWAYLKIINLEPIELNWHIEEYWTDDWKPEEGELIFE